MMKTYFCSSFSAQDYSSSGSDVVVVVVVGRRSNDVVAVRVVVAVARPNEIMQKPMFVGWDVMGLTHGHSLDSSLSEDEVN